MATGKRTGRRKTTSEWYDQGKALNIPGYLTMGRNRLATTLGRA
jgi:hypothetical protein